MPSAPPPGGRRAFFIAGRDVGTARSIGARMGSSTADLNFSLFLPPSLLSVTPNIGVPGGGLVITLGGLAFRPGATVTFGGVAATGVVVNGPTSITCTNPAHAAGAVDVAVTNPDGQSSTLVSGFTYNLSPLVAVANIGSVAALSIDGGATWTPKVIPSGQYIVMTQGGAGGPIVAAGGVKARSDDGGQTWNAFTITGSGYNGVAWNGSIFLAYNGGHAYTSPDGITWTDHAGTGLSIVNNCLLYNGAGLFVIAQNGANSIVTTANGTSFTNRSALGVLCAGLARNGATIIGMPFSTGTVGLRSADGGLTWATITVPSASYRASAFGNGVFVSVGNGSCAVSSNDGLTWANSAIPVGIWDGITFSDGQFIAVGPSGGCATSPDGTGWVTHAMPSTIFNSIIPVL